MCLKITMVEVRVIDWEEIMKAVSQVIKLLQ